MANLDPQAYRDGVARRRDPDKQKKRGPLYRAMIKRLTAAREAAGLSQEEAGRRIKRPQSHVSKIERGEVKLDPIELCELAALYDRPVTDFLPDLRGTQTDE